LSEYRKKFGSWGEDIAVEYLQEKGFTIITRNFRALRGEIDIIARDGNTIVFVEVKTGNSKKYGPPEERVTRGKQRQLYRIAQAFIQQTNIPDVDYRFDVVIVDGNSNSYEIRYYPQAFYF